jgi:hypothetical protein
MAKHAARRVWYALRGAILATLGISAAYALSLALHGLAWQTGAGALVFLTTILTVGTLGFRMTVWDAVEEPAATIRTVIVLAWTVTALALAFTTALIGVRP